MEGYGLWEAEPDQVERHTAGIRAGRMGSLEESLADSAAPEKGRFGLRPLEQRPRDSRHGEVALRNLSTRLGRESR